MSILNTKIDLKAYEEHAITDYDPYEVNTSDILLAAGLGILAIFLIKKSSKIMEVNNWLYDRIMLRLI